MKKIINGKSYDTETATLVGKWENGCSSNDLKYFSEQLFRKKNGEYFLHGEGGAMTRYSFQTGDNSWSGGERIIPISYAAAAEWSENHMNSDEYEAEFGDIVDDNSRRVITLSLPVSIIERAKRASSENGLSLSAYIGSLIDKF